MRDLLADAAAILGLAAFLVGLWQVSPLAAGGVVAMVAGVLLNRVRPSRGGVRR